MKMLRFFNSLIAAATLLAGLCAGVHTAYGDWTNVWSDEFNGANVDSSKWIFDIGTGPPYPGWGNDEREYYTSRTNNVYVTNGVLHIVARQENYMSSSYTSARLKTQGLFAKKYGRFEFRALLPHGQGYWPALWLLPYNSPYGAWAASGEVDIMENKGASYNVIGGTLIYGGQYPNQIYNSTSYTVPTSVTNFHVYALEWNTNSFKWYVDDVLYKTTTSWSSTAASYPAPFDQSFYILMNLAVGGNYGGDPDGSTVFPGEMQVDYVRVYDFVPVSSPPTTPTGLTATPGGLQIALNWNLSTNATSYNVKRSLVNGGPYTRIATPTATSYNDTNVVGLTTYYYVISATNSLGESANSVQASATPSPPSTPTGLTATPGGASVAIDWNSSSGATAYKVKRSPVSGGPYTFIAMPASTSYTDTGVVNCTTYYYVVSATNSLGESTNSGEATATMGAYALAVNSGGSTASPFIADANVTGGTVAAPTGVAISTVGVTNPAPQSVYQTERYGTFTYTFTGLTTGTAYNVRLHFAEYYFNGANARKFNVTINGTQLLTNYDIFAAAGGQNRAIVPEYMITPNGSGQIIIQFTLGDGSVDQPKSSGIEVILPSPVAPTGLTATGGISQVALNWNASAGATGYNVKRATTGGGPYATVTNGLTNTTYTNTGLVAGTTYYYVVSSLKAGCESAASAEANGTPLTAFAQWQQLYFGCTGCPQADAGADPDGDGQNNMAEFMAGTDPSNSDSSFRIISIAPEGSDNIRVTWTMGSGRTNALQAAGDEVGNYVTNFTDIFTVTNTIGSITNYLDISAATNQPARYYRIRLVP